MTVQGQLSSSLGRRDQRPNKELAVRLLRDQDHEGIEQLIAILKHPQNTDLTADALKVMEIIGKEDPDLVREGFRPASILLSHPQNKIQWRAMAAISNVAGYFQEELFQALSQLLDIMDQGTVVTRDHGFSILVMLYQNPPYQPDLYYLIQEQLLSAPDNQLGQYAEKWLKVIRKSHLPALEEVLQKRQPELTSPSHQRRIQKILKRIRRAKISLVLTVASVLCNGIFFA